MKIKNKLISGCIDFNITITVHLTAKLAQPSKIKQAQKLHGWSDFFVYSYADERKKKTRIEKSALSNFPKFKEKKQRYTQYVL